MNYTAEEPGRKSAVIPGIEHYGNYSGEILRQAAGMALGWCPGLPKL